MRWCALLLVLLIAACDFVVSDRANSEMDSMTEKPPPKIFPRVPEDKDSEVDDLLGVGDPTPNPEADKVDHPNVMDPNRTHEEGGQAPKVGAPVIHTCNFSKSWLNRSQELEGCSLPSDWLNSNDSLHICTINKEWLRANNYTIRNGSVSNELLAETNSGNIRCVTPKEALTDGGNDTSHYSTVLPQAWLKEGNNIYIYLVPEDVYYNLTETAVEVLANETTSENTTTTTTSMNSSKDNKTAPITSAVTQTSNNSNETESATEQSIEGNITTSTTSPVTEEPTKGNVTAFSNSTEAQTSTNSNVTGSTTEQSTEVNITASDTSPVTEEPTRMNATAVKDNSTVNQTKNNATISSVSPSTSGENVTVAVTEGSVKNNESQPAKEESTAPIVSPVTLDNTTAVMNNTTAAKVNPPPTEVDEAENMIEPEQGPAALLQRHTDHDHSSSTGKTAFLQPTESAAILAGVFVGIAVLGYVGLLVWRRFLERRYGHREMLVNEDDDFDTSDMRHFEL